MDIKVVDMDYNERDLAWAQEKYGVAFRRYPAHPGQTVYRLVKLQEKTGHSSLITQVLGKNGEPINQKDVAFYWPNAPKPPDPPTTLLEWDWYPNFVHGLTNLNGEVGPGMGKGAYYGAYPKPEDKHGPHAVWIRDFNFPSDICEKLGMLAGTFHDHLDQVFQRIVEGEEPEPEPKPPEPEPPPPEPEPTGWEMTMEVVPAAGLRLLICTFPTNGIHVSVVSPWGSTVYLVSGSKGSGWCETPLWADGSYTIKFLDQSFAVPISANSCMKARFAESPTSEPEDRRLVSKRMARSIATRLLSELEVKGFSGIFTEENI